MSWPQPIADPHHDLATITGVVRVMLASVDGLPVDPATPDPVIPRLAAVGATLVGLGQRVGDLTGGGAFSEAVLRSEGGLLAAYQVDHVLVLIVVADDRVNLGHLNIMARRAARQFAHSRIPRHGHETVAVP